MRETWKRSSVNAEISHVVSHRSCRPRNESCSSRSHWTALICNAAAADRSFTHWPRTSINSTRLNFITFRLTACTAETHAVKRKTYDTKQQGYKPVISNYFNSLLPLNSSRLHTKIGNRRSKVNKSNKTHWLGLRRSNVLLHTRSWEVLHAHKKSYVLFTEALSF